MSRTTLALLWHAASITDTAYAWHAVIKRLGEIYARAAERGEGNALIRTLIERATDHQKQAVRRESRLRKRAYWRRRKLASARLIRPLIVSAAR